MFYFCIGSTLTSLQTTGYITYASSCLCVPVSNEVVESSPSPGFRRCPKTTRRGKIFENNFGCMQQLGGQTWHGAHRF